MDMIERVAAALKKANETWARAAPMMDGFHEKSVYHFMARAAVESMREPTEEMIRRGAEDDYYVEYAWRYMIDEALKEPAPKKDC